jgi:hypothetical protein
MTISDSGDLEGSEEGDSEMDINDSNDEDYSPWVSRRKRCFLRANFLFHILATRILLMSILSYLTKP